MKKLLALLLALLFLLTAGSLAAAETIPFPGGPVVGIAWRADTDSEFFTSICRAVEAAVVKHLDNMENKDDFMDYDTAMKPFLWLMEQISELMEDAA